MASALTKSEYNFLILLIIFSVILGFVAISRTTTLRKQAAATNVSTGLSNLLYDPSKNQLVNFTPLKDTGLVAAANTVTTQLVTFPALVPGLWMVYWTNGTNSVVSTVVISLNASVSIINGGGLAGVAVSFAVQNYYITLSLSATTLTGTWSVTAIPFLSGVPLA